MLDRIIYHLKRGTLMDAISYKISMYKWRRFSKGKEFFFYEAGDGIKLKLYTDSMFSRIIWQGSFEEDELAFMKAFIKPGDAVLDIGANIGLHALVASRLAGEKGKIYAAEPVDYIFKRLKENIELNGADNIHLVKKAFSNNSGTAEITVSLEGYDAWNSLGGQSGLTGEKFGREAIQTITLDDFLATESLTLNDVNFIKIDTEGWEFNVLSGATALKGGDAPLLMIEYSDEISNNFGFTTEMVFDKLTAYGYKLFDYGHKNNSLRLLKKGGVTPSYNAIAVKDERQILDRIPDIKIH